MSDSPRDKTEARLYDGLVSFNETAQWNMLRLPQMRQYLAEHLANALVPSWLHERKAETAGEEIAHVLLMFGLFPPDWVDAYKAEVLAEDGQAYDGELAMLRGLFRTLRVVVRHDGNLAEVWRLLVQHTQDDAAARAQEKSSRQADATPDFFQPGTTYRNGLYTFHCHGIGPHPTTGETRAVGWLTHTDRQAPQVWAMDPDDWAAEQGGWANATTNTTTGDSQ